MRSCPRCTWPLSAFAHQGVELDHCRRCGGTFLDPGEASSLFGAAAEPQRWREDPSARSHGESKLFCPSGHAKLEIHVVQFEGSEVEVDTCPRCHGLWLDREEGAKLYNIVASSRAHAHRLEHGTAKPGLGSYVFQVLTGFPMEVWNPVKHKPVIVYAVMAMLVTAFGMELFAAMTMGASYEPMLMSLALVPADPTPWSFLTYGLLHGGFWHIIGNLYFLYTFGDNVEDALGPKQFIILYLASNVAGGVGHYLFNLGSPIPMLGASGAVSGLMGAYLVLFPRVKMYVMLLVFRFRIGVVWYLGFWVGYQLLMAASGVASVAWFAHIGGFVAGAAVAFFYRNKLRIGPTSV